MKTKVHNHASILLAYLDEKVVSNIYDDTYPKEIWRGRINLIGGGQNPGDISPRSLLEREINEEFAISKEEIKEYDKNFKDLVGEGNGAPGIDLFASKKEIDFVNNFLLNNIKPWKDFLITFPPYKSNPSFNIMFSSYFCNLSKEIMDCFYENLSKKKSLVSEGFLKITPLSDISSGKVLTAWATGVVIEDFFNINVPNPEKIFFQKLTVPKSSMRDYFKEYNYFLK
ncbi:MAG TPA: hypothetical protein PK357_00945 [Candidatus Pacearchaeota archaeon]|nr:hypothetical protein [Candidatus Pacearchaeota archaeon]